MIPPIAPPSFIQTVHGLTYRVNPIATREENEDPERRPTRGEADALTLGATRPRRSARDQSGQADSPQD